jgi:hypothetical protein
MIARLISWLNRSSTQQGSASTSPPPPKVRSIEGEAVPVAARALGHELLRAVLRQFGLGDRIASISEMEIATHRVLIESLPFRVYVYTLGSFMGDMEFKSILGSQRPTGAVFDAFETEIDGVRCGFYVYSLQPISDQAQMRRLWLQLRETADREVTTAKLPDIHTQHHTPRVSLAGPPDDVAANLIAPNSPSKFLDDFILDDANSVAELFVNLMKRMGKASIEKDEMIRFVERNRTKLLSQVVALLRAASEAAEETDKSGTESTRAYFSYVLENIELAANGKHDRMDMRSDRLFWLVYALAHQLDSGSIDWDQARELLRRPATAQRISEHQLIYMIHDWAEALDSPQQAPTTLLMLVCECAMIGGSSAALRGAATIVAKHLVLRHRAATIDLLTRAGAWLSARGDDAADIKAAAQALEKKGRPIGDDEF